MKKALALLMAMAMILALCACGASAAPAAAAAPAPAAEPVVETVVKEPTDAEYEAWALDHGYTKPLPELVTSATEQGGGINYGGIPWTEELKKAAIAEFLKGGTAIADPNYAQDASGFNYRNMMQMATRYNDVPNCSNLELVLNLDKLTLCGISEAGTSKVNEFLANPTVCVSWSRQISPAEEEKGYNYFGSYGLSFYGTVKNYSVEDLATPEGQDGAIRVFDTYYNTGASFWAGYSKGFAELTDEAAIREAKLAYIGNLIGSGSMFAYEIIPTRVVLTAPFCILLVPQYSNALLYTKEQPGADKYAYELGIRDEFIDMMRQVKADYLADANNMKAVEEYYAGGYFAMLDPMLAQQNMPSHIEMVKDLSHAGGLMSQVTYTP